MKTFFIFILVVSFCHAHSVDKEGKDGALKVPASPRRLGVGLDPTPVPYEPPGFKPTTTPTDRTKKPTRPPTRIPTTPIPTRRPTAPYPCALCRPDENPFKPLWEIFFKGTQQTCAFVDSLGDLTGTIDPDDCDFYRNLGQYACMCKKGTPPPSGNICTLCEDGSALPNPSKKVMENLRCSSFQTSAKSDEVKTCVKYQGGIGTYCGCDNPVADTKVCRLCEGKKLLPSPNRVVKNMTCIEHEFTANFAKGCAATRANVGKACCASS